MNKEIIFSGLGGQGIILTGYIAGKAASIYDDLFATMVQSYGPESRGGSCSTQVIVSDKDVTYPIVTHPDVLIVMSQGAYNKYAADLKPGGIMLVEQDMVKMDAPRKDVKIFKIPASKLAEEVGKRMVANIVMLGFFAAKAKVVSEKAMQEAIKSSVPPGTEELNIKAFLKGFNYAGN
ncbi:MAG: 2-oxoacid:acceptor oxidoreductase family protein [Planctomycetes bacterium]|nr:2-oxoacid:acceptor oxidoreductase family protein [Planctomycetota bacterium]